MQSRKDGLLGPSVKFTSRRDSNTMVMDNNRAPYAPLRMDDEETEFEKPKQGKNSSFFALWIPSHLLSNLLSAGLCM
jgi:hypothetical protein